jgi:type I restriction enzyme M protein
MNLLLHGIGSPEDESPIRVDDALRADPGERFSMVLTNPPFGKKSSVAVVGQDGGVERESLTVVRDDFAASTSNKQLNFVQHVRTLIASSGRAAMVVPDTSSSRAAPGKPYAGACSPTATSTRCSGCPPESSTRRA